MRQLALGLFCLILITASQTANARDKVLDIQEVTSNSGITAWLVEDHSIPVIAIEFAFLGAGSAHDPADKQGLARLVSNTLDEGAGDYSAKEFQETLNDHSIQLSFSSSRDHFGGSLKTLSSNQYLAYTLLTLALTDPRFDEDAITRMRDANKSRIRSSLADPNWIAARILNDQAFAGHPYAQNSGGTLTTLDNITREDLKNFHQSFLGKNNLVIGVSGDMTAEDLSSTLDVVFGELPEVQVPPTPKLETVQNQDQIALYKKDIPQTIINMIQPGIDRSHEDYYIAQVMNHILGASGFGSRLTETIREQRGLTYGIYSYFMDMAGFDGLAVSTSTKNENVPEMLDLIQKEWQKIQAEPVSKTELNDTISYLTGSLPLSFTSTNRIAGTLVALQEDKLPMDYLDKRQARIKAVSQDDIKRVANDLLNINAMTTVLVGQPAVLVEPKLITDLPNAE